MGRGGPGEVRAVKVDLPGGRDPWGPWGPQGGDLDGSNESGTTGPTGTCPQIYDGVSVHARSLGGGIREAKPAQGYLKMMFNGWSLCVIGKRERISQIARTGTT